MNREIVFKELGVTNPVLIGEGQESEVYDLQDGQVLKLLKRANLRVIDNEKGLYESLAQNKVLIEFPHIVKVGECDDTKYLLEKKLSGVPMDKVIEGTRDSEHKRSLLRSMLSAIRELSSIQLEDKLYGELITETPLQAESWTSFFKQNVTTVFEKNREEIEVTSPLKEKTELRFLEQFDKLLGDKHIPKSVVHGDFWPPNLLVEKDRVVAIIDFNEQTVVGDSRVDIASAIAFTEKWLDSEEKEYLTQEVESMFGHIQPILSLYILYYAFLFAGVKDTDQESYDWAKKVLSESDKILVENLSN